MTSLPIAPMPVDDCPLCLLAALIERVDPGDYEIVCTHCGEFFLSDSARVLVQGLPTRFRLALQLAVRELVEQGTAVHITMQNVVKMVSPYL